MKKEKSMAGFFIVLFVFLGFTGCNNVFGPFKSNSTGDVSILLRIPDYRNTQENSTSRQVNKIISYTQMSRIVDPATYTVEITVSAPDIAATTSTFSFGESGSYQNGVGTIECLVKDIPAGTARSFTAETKDISGNVLAAGSGTADIKVNETTTLSILLIPVSVEVLTLDTSVNGSVAYGNMKYYSVSLPDEGTYYVILTSDQDTDIYIYNGDGSLYSNEYLESGAPTDETGIIENQGSASYYLGVLGNTEGVTNTFTLLVTMTPTYLMGGAIQGTDLGLAGAVTTYAGQALVSGSADGTGTSAQFYNPYGITTDGTNLYVADYSNHTIRKIVISTAEVTTLAGLAGSFGSTDGTGSAARFYYPCGITTDGTNLYVADNSNHTIRKIVISTGEVTTLAGLAGTTGWDDGTGNLARFNYPYGITTDGTNLYVADTSNYIIRKIVISTAEVTTLAGLHGVSNIVDGTGTSAQFSSPYGITTDGTNLYVLDSHTIRKIVISTAEVTTIAGQYGSYGSTDGTGTAALFYNPSGITTDGTNLYVMDTFNHTVRKIVISTVAVSTLAGQAGVAGTADGTGSSARFRYPTGATTDGTSLFVGGENYTIRKID